MIGAVERTLEAVIARHSSQGAMTGYLDLTRTHRQVDPARLSQRLVKTEDVHPVKEVGDLRLHPDLVCRLLPGDHNRRVLLQRAHHMNFTGHERAGQLFDKADPALQHTIGMTPSLTASRTARYFCSISRWKGMSASIVNSRMSQGLPMAQTMTLNEVIPV